MYARKNNGFIDFMVLKNRESGNSELDVLFQEMKIVKSVNTKMDFLCDSISIGKNLVLQEGREFYEDE